MSKVRTTDFAGRVPPSRNAASCSALIVWYPFSSNQSICERNHSVVIMISSLKRKVEWWYSMMGIRSAGGSGVGVAVNEAVAVWIAVSVGEGEGGTGDEVRVGFGGAAVGEPQAEKRNGRTARTMMLLKKTATPGFVRGAHTGPAECGYIESVVEEGGCETRGEDCLANTARLIRKLYLK